MLELSTYHEIDEAERNPDLVIPWGLLSNPNPGNKPPLRYETGEYSILSVLRASNEAPEQRIAAVKQMVEIICGMPEELRRIADSLLSTQDFPFEVMRNYVHPFPWYAICSALGKPEASEALWELIIPYLRHNLDAQQVNSSIAFCDELAEGTVLEPLLEHRANVLTVMFYVAGFETTQYGLGNALLTILTHPEQRKQLMADPSLYPDAILEIMRYSSNVIYRPRQAVRDTRVGDHFIKKGENIALLIALANFDPSAYPAPDELDFSRPAPRPLFFGGGHHTCLGMKLGRLEIEIGVRAFIEHPLRLELIGFEDRIFDPYPVNGLETLYVSPASPLES